MSSNNIARAVIGIAPTGERVFFASARQASIRLGANVSSVWKCLNYGNQTHGWRFDYHKEGDEQGCVPLAKVLGYAPVEEVDLAALRQEARDRRNEKQETRRKERCASRAAAIRRGTLVPMGKAPIDPAAVDRYPIGAVTLADIPGGFDKKCEAEIAHEARERAHLNRILAQPHGVGYYEADMLGCKCPVCGQYVNNTKDNKGRPKGWKHLQVCLEGHDYIIRPGGKIYAAL